MAELTALGMLDAFFRFSGISLFLLLGVLILRDFANRQIAWLGAWASLTGAAYLVCTSAPLKDVLGSGMIVVESFCHTGQIAIWLFSLSQFRDKLRLWPHYVMISVAFYLWSRLYFDWYFYDESALGILIEYVNGAARFGLIAHMIYVAWTGRGDDLIEARRRFRMIYIVTVSITVLAVVITETLYDPLIVQNDQTMLVQSFGMWLLSMVLVWQVINLRTTALFSGEPADRGGQKPVLDDPNERHDLDTVERLIKTDELYLRPGLTIAGLAGEAGLPEHRLRRLINMHLGYRNFADFLNHYRITAAKTQLSSIENRNIPVLTVAMDLGYGSLGPFNRAFKERTGQTPTEYRRKKLADS